MGLKECIEVFRLGETQGLREASNETSMHNMSDHSPWGGGGLETDTPWVPYLLENLVRANYVVCVGAQASQGSR